MYQPYYNFLKKRFQPDKHNMKLFSKVDQRKLASFVGLFATGLPMVLFLGSFFTCICFHESISHFYYSVIFGDLFIGILIFISIFLFAYRGDNQWENRLATLVGIATIIVALIPTSGSGCYEEFFTGRVFATGELNGSKLNNPSTTFELASHAQTTHNTAALILFFMLALFSFLVFPRIKCCQIKDNKLQNAKKNRNLIYIVSGIIIVISIATIVINTLFVESDLWNEWKLTFWFETAALWAFGISWLLKGRFCFFSCLRD